MLRPSQVLGSNLEGGLEIGQRTPSSRATAELDWLLRTNKTTLNTKRVSYSPTRASVCYCLSIALLIWLISVNHKLPCIGWCSCVQEWCGWTILRLLTTHHTYLQSQPSVLCNAVALRTHMCMVSFPVALGLAMLMSWLVPVGQASQLPAPKLSDWSQEISDKLENCKITGISGQPCARHISMNMGTSPSRTTVNRRISFQRGLGSICDSV